MTDVPSLPRITLLQRARQPRAVSESRAREPSPSVLRRIGSDPALATTTALEAPLPARVSSPELEMEPLDPTLRTALANPRDRFLLLRAEAELERFLASPTLHRLPLAAPHFPPLLNSYQRLLIHRLADTFGIRREVEPSPLWVNGAPAPVTPGLVVLVKGDSARIPTVKLAVLVPAPVVVQSSPTSTTVSASEPTSPSISPSTSSSSALLPAPVPQYFKILPRSSPRSSSSASSSVADDEGKGKEKARRDLTLEERELAYREARERIFNSSDSFTDADSVAGTEETSAAILRPSSAGSTYSRSSVASHRLSPSYPSPSLYAGSHYGGGGSSTSTSSGSVYYSQGPGAPSGSLRPSAPAFDPTAAHSGPGWSAYSYASTSTSYQHGNGDYSTFDEAQYGVTYGTGMDRTSYGPQTQTRSVYAYSQQPPIQVIAPSPHPQHAVYPPAPLHPAAVYGAPSEHYRAAPQAFPALPSMSTLPYAPSQGPHPVQTAWPRQAPLLSPALSASSAGSSYQHAVPVVHPSSQPGTTPVPTGYIMRFPEGVVYPSPLAYPPYAPPLSRSVGSTGSVGSASTSRTASSSNLKSSVTGASSAAGGVESYGLGGAPSVRRTSHSATTSLSSTSACGVSSKAPSSIDLGGAGTTKCSTSSSTSRSGSSFAGSDSGRDGSDKGKMREPVGDHVEQQGLREDKVDEQEGTRLHPSLPAKPVWTVSAPPSTSVPEVRRPSIATPMAPPPPTPIQSFEQPNYHHPQYAAAPPPPMLSSLAPQYYAPAPQRPPAWTDGAIVAPHASPYHPYAPQQYHPYPHELAMGQYPPLSIQGVEYGDGGRGIAPPSEQRRPTPRSTALFDPNTPRVPNGKRNGVVESGGSERGTGAEGEPTRMLEHLTL